MPYKFCPKAAVSKLIKEYNQLAIDWDKADKKKDVNAKKLLVPKLNNSGSAIKKQLKSDMEAIEKNYTTHKQKIDKLVQESDFALQQAKVHVETYKKTRRKEPLDDLVECFNRASAAADDGAVDAKAFGEAWVEFRALNEFTQHVPEDWTQEFMKGREHLITDQKVTNVKVEKLNHNAGLVEALIKSARASQVTLPLEIEKEAQYLAARLPEMFRQDAKMINYNYEQKLSNLRSGAQKKDDNVDLSMYQSTFTDLKNLAEKWDLKFKAMKDVYDKTYAGLVKMKDDPVVKPLIAKGFMALAQAAKEKKSSSTAYSEAAQLYKTIEERRKN